MDLYLHSLVSLYGINRDMTFEFTVSAGSTCVVRD